MRCATSFRIHFLFPMICFFRIHPNLPQKCTGEANLSWFCFLPFKEIDFKKEDISKIENLTKIQTFSMKKNQTAKKLKEKIHKIHSP